MKCLRFLVFLILFAIVFSACSSRSWTPDIKGRSFVCENGGFGSDFTIYFGEDGAFRYYEGMFSSHIGLGSYRVEGDMVILSEIMQGQPRTFCFRIGEEDITFIKERSDHFMYLDIPDGTRFYQAENGKLFNLERVF